MLPTTRRPRRQEGKSQTCLTVIAALQQPLSVGFSSSCDVQIKSSPDANFSSLLSKLCFSPSSEQSAGGKKERKIRSQVPSRLTLRGSGLGATPLLETHAEYFLFLNELEAEAPTASVFSWQMSEGEKENRLRENVKPDGQVLRPRRS